MTSVKVSETVPTSISITQNCFALIHYLHKAKFNGHNKDIRRTKSYFTEDNSFYFIPMSDMITRNLDNEDKSTNRLYCVSAITLFDPSTSDTYYYGE